MKQCRMMISNPRISAHRVGFRRSSRTHTDEFFVFGSEAACLCMCRSEEFRGSDFSDVQRTLVASCKKVLPPVMIGDQYYQLPDYNIVTIHVLITLVHAEIALVHVLIILVHVLIVK